MDKKSSGELDCSQENLRVELTGIINRFSLDTVSSTPDFILADYLLACLDAYNKTANSRNSWYNGTANEDKK